MAKAAYSRFTTDYAARRLACEMEILASHLTMFEMFGKSKFQQVRMSADRAAVFAKHGLKDSKR
jgi:predicted FMN-binding regulatory protein PaiB